MFIDTSNSDNEIEANGKASLDPPNLDDISEFYDRDYLDSNNTNINRTQINEQIPDSKDFSFLNATTYSPANPNSKQEALEVSIGIQKKNISNNNKALARTSQKTARNKALEAQKARVSRRLLLAIRSTQVTVVCPITGIVSLMDLPVIPGQALQLEHPLSNLPNVRGIAQQGISYLRQLDTQVLAGLFIVLAEHYSLVRFQPFDSGAQKNAILRTAGKDSLIDGIILVEDSIHSGNYKYLPSLSLVFDSNMQEYGVAIRFSAYLTLLAEAIAKPDTIAYDENQKPKKIGRPVYIKDIEKQTNKVSFLARQELAKAKAQFKEDKKTIKAIVNKAYNEGNIKANMRNFFLSVVTDDSLLTIPEESITKILGKIEDIEAMAPISIILQKDRKILSLDISEVEDMFSVEDNEAESQGSDDEDAEDDDGIDNEEEDREQEPTIQEITAVAMPSGLSFVEQVIWKKRHLPGIKKNIVQNINIPSVHQYKPSHELKIRGE